MIKFGKDGRRRAIGALFASVALIVTASAAAPASANQPPVGGGGGDGCVGDTYMSASDGKIYDIARALNSAVAVRADHHS